MLFKVYIQILSFILDMSTCSQHFEFDSVRVVRLSPQNLQREFQEPTLIQPPPIPPPPPRPAEAPSFTTAEAEPFSLRILVCERNNSNATLLIFMTPGGDEQYTLA